MSLMYVYHAVEIIIALSIYFYVLGEQKNGKFLAGGSLFISLGITSLLGYLIDIPLLGRYTEGTGKESLIISLVFLIIGLLLVLYFRKK